MQISVQKHVLPSCIAIIQCEMMLGGATRSVPEWFQVCLVICRMTGKNFLTALWSGWKNNRKNNECVAKRFFQPIDTLSARQCVKCKVSLKALISTIKAALVCLSLTCRTVFNWPNSLWVCEACDYRSHCNCRNRILRQCFWSSCGSPTHPNMGWFKQKWMMRNTIHSQGMFKPAMQMSVGQLSSCTVMSCDLCGLSHGFVDSFHQLYFSLLNVLGHGDQIQTWFTRFDKHFFALFLDVVINVFA